MGCCGWIKNANVLQKAPPFCLSGSTQRHHLTQSPSHTPPRIKQQLTSLQACKVAPCSTVWQRVGVGHYLAGACDKADMALAQANIMDDRNAVAWGWMVAVHLRQGRRDEAEGCLR